MTSVFSENGKRFDENKIQICRILIPNHEFVIRFNVSQLVKPLLAQQTKISTTEKYILGLAFKVGIHL